MIKTFLKVSGGALAAILLVIGAFHVFAPGIPTETPAFSAVSSADINSPYLAVNGVRRWYTRQALTTATNTPCTIKTPAATSTMLFGDVNITTATSTQTTWTVANDTTRYATTTPLAPNFTLGSGAFGTLATMASSSPNVPAMLAPNTYVVWSVAGTVISGTAKLNGTCQAVFQEI